MSDDVVVHPLEDGTDVIAYPLQVYEISAAPVAVCVAGTEQRHIAVPQPPAVFFGGYRRRQRPPQRAAPPRVPRPVPPQRLARTVAVTAEVSASVELEVFPFGRWAEEELMLIFDLL